MPEHPNIASNVGGEAVELVWNKGIAASCDRRVPDEFPDGRTYSPVPTGAGMLPRFQVDHQLTVDAAAFGDVSPGELIWVRLSWLRFFVEEVLPFIHNPFVLVTGDTDSCVPSEVDREAGVILECSRVIHWYTQNYDGSTPLTRVSPLPIGIDFHTLSERPLWGECVSSPREQERELRTVAQSLGSRTTRENKVYVDFAWQRSLGLRDYRRVHPLKGTSFHENRRRVAKKLSKNGLAICQRARLPRKELWRQRGRYTFVLSPHGMGLDCHRTWEALALGHIVLVPSSALDVLYADLPVVPLHSWQDIRADNLSRWRSLYTDNAEVPRKLTSHYWVEAMRAMATQRLEV